MTDTAKAAFWLEGKRPIFAVYQGPLRGARDLGVVLCNSFGHEMMSAHRAYRHLAERLAAAGFPTLRFDYDGTGDSSGGDEDDDRPSSWLSSIDQAVGLLMRKGVDRVALVGVRFGALLAADYARTKPVDALILVAPPSTGRAYVRELTALHSLRFGHLTEGNSPGPGSGQEVVGFLLNEGALDYLQQLALVGAARPARRALVVARDDLPGYESRLVQKLTDLGVDVTHSQVAGYGAMSGGDPVKSVVPDAIWTEIIEWLAEPRRGGGATRDISCAFEPQAIQVRSSDSSPCVHEKIVDIEGMFGILTTPLQKARAGAPLIVLNNVGANHHVGCNRIYVEMARHWATLGFSTVRFDLVGIGDTPAGKGRKENDVYSELGIGDVRRALDSLTKSGGWDRFVLGGICSGAYVSYYAGLADARVRGVILINQLTFHWREGDSLDVRMRTTFKSTDFYRRAAMQVATWKRVARGQVHLGAIMQKIAERGWMRIKRWPAQWLRQDTDVALGFRRLSERGASVMVVCGEDDASCDLIAEHLGPNAERLRHDSNFRFALISDTDHTFAPQAARRVLMAELTGLLIDTDPTVASTTDPSTPDRQSLGRSAQLR
jgi:pimeloyl-ACP methyl ester carboxylesterase